MRTALILLGLLFTSPALAQVALPLDRQTLLRSTNPAANGFYHQNTISLNALTSFSNSYMGQIQAELGTINKSGFGCGIQYSFNSDSYHQLKFQTDFLQFDCRPGSSNRRSFGVSYELLHFREENGQYTTIPDLNFGYLFRKRYFTFGLSTSNLSRIIATDDAFPPTLNAYLNYAMRLNRKTWLDLESFVGAQINGFALRQGVLLSTNYGQKWLELFWSSDAHIGCSARYKLVFHKSHQYMYSQIYVGAGVNYSYQDNKWFFSFNTTLPLSNVRAIRDRKKAKASPGNRN